MIKFFSDIKASNSLFILLFLLVIRAFFLIGPFDTFIKNSEQQDYVGLVFSFLNVSKLVSFLLSTAIIYFSALLLNNLLIQHDVLFQRNYLGAYFYCICTSFFPEYFYLSPSIVINLFMILSLHRLFELYKAPNPIDNIFLSGLLAGMCVLFSFSYVIILLYLLLGIAFFRTLNPKEMFAALLGFVLPPFIGIALNFIVNGEFLPAYFTFPTFNIQNLTQYMLLSPISLVLAIAVVATLRIVRNFWRNTIKTRRILQLLYIYLGLTLILTLSGKGDQLQESMLVALPISIILAHYFTVNGKLGWIRKSIHISILLLIIFYQYRFLIH